jgi:hypothetical protein
MRTVGNWGSAAIAEAAVPLLLLLLPLCRCGFRAPLLLDARVGARWLPVETGANRRTFE